MQDAKELILLIFMFNDMYMCVCRGGECAHVSVGAWRAQKRALDLLERSKVGAGNQTQALWKSTTQW